MFPFAAVSFMTFFHGASIKLHLVLSCQCRWTVYLREAIVIKCSCGSDQDVAGASRKRNRPVFAGRGKHRKKKACRRAYVLQGALRNSGTSTPELSSPEAQVSRPVCLIETRGGKKNKPAWLHRGASNSRSHMEARLHRVKEEVWSTHPAVPSPLHTASPLSARDKMRVQVLVPVTVVVSLVLFGLVKVRRKTQEMEEKRTRFQDIRLRVSTDVLSEYRSHRSQQQQELATSRDERLILEEAINSLKDKKDEADEKLKTCKEEKVGRGGAHEWWWCETDLPQTT